MYVVTFSKKFMNNKRTRDYCPFFNKALSYLVYRDFLILHFNYNIAKTCISFSTFILTIHSYKLSTKVEIKAQTQIAN